MNNEKIVQAVNSMRQNPENITNIQIADDEIYFKYKKYVWSIVLNSDGNYTLFYYPYAGSVEDIVDEDGAFMHDSKYTVHPAKELGPDATSAFRLLFLKLKDKAYNFSGVLDDIISDDPFADE